MLLKHWIDLVQKFKLLVIVIAIAIGSLALIYTKIMLSAELNWRKLDLEYEANFPQYTDNLLVVLEVVCTH